MPGRLDRIEAILREELGDALVDCAGSIVYNVNHALVRFGRTQDSLGALLSMIDSSLFNDIYQATQRSMLVVRSDGKRARVTTDQIRLLADRLLALVYEDAPATQELQAALFDLSREGSLHAMRVLASRYPLDEFERAYLLRVLEENE